MRERHLGVEPAGGARVQRRARRRGRRPPRARSTARARRRARRSRARGARTARPGAARRRRRSRGRCSPPARGPGAWSRARCRRARCGARRSRPGWRPGARRAAGRPRSAPRCEVEPDVDVARLRLALADRGRGVRAASARSTGSRRGSACWLRASTISESSSACVRSAASSTTSPIWRSSAAEASGSASATSTSARMMVSGVRSSWLALATKRRWPSKAAARRSSIPSSVSARSRSSSRGPVHGDPLVEPLLGDALREAGDPAHRRQRAAGDHVAERDRDQQHADAGEHSTGRRAARAPARRSPAAACGRPGGARSTS